MAPTSPAVNPSPAATPAPAALASIGDSPAAADAGSSSPGWSLADSLRLYGLERWGDPYFSVNERGHVIVQPRGDRGGALDLVELVEFGYEREPERTDSGTILRDRNLGRLE